MIISYFQRTAWLRSRCFSLCQFFQGDKTNAVILDMDALAAFACGFVRCADIDPADQITEGSGCQSSQVFVLMYLSDKQSVKISDSLLQTGQNSGAVQKSQRTVLATFWLEFWRITNSFLNANLTRQESDTANPKTEVKLSTCHALERKKHCGTIENFPVSVSGIYTYHLHQNRGLQALWASKRKPKRNRIAARQRKENPCPEMQWRKNSRQQCRE